MIDAQEVLESVGHLALALLDGFGRITGPDDIPYPKWNEENDDVSEIFTLGN